MTRIDGVLRVNGQGRHNRLDERLGLWRLGDGPTHLWVRHARGQMIQQRYELSEGGVFYREGTTPAVMAVLDKLIAKEAIGERVKTRLFFGDADTGEDWLRDFDVVGFVEACYDGRFPGRQAMLAPLAPDPENGFEPVPLRTREIVRIQADRPLVEANESGSQAPAKAGKLRDVLRHPNYHQPTIEMRPAQDRGHPHGVGLEGQDVVFKSFATNAQREAWVKFVQGARTSAKLTGPETRAAADVLAQRQAAASAAQAKAEAAAAPARPAKARGPALG